MRKTLLAVAAIVGVFAFATQSFSMGGGGGGGSSGGGGSYGGFGGSSTRQTADDYTIALRLIKHQQFADAIPHLGSALAEKPQDADILNYLGFAHRMVGQGLSPDGQADEFKMSLGYYQRALAINPNHRGVHEYLGELYLQMHDQASADNEMKILETLCPSGCDERDTLAKAIATNAAPIQQSSSAQ